MSKTNRRDFLRKAGGIGVLVAAPALATRPLDFLDIRPKFKRFGHPGWRRVFGKGGFTYRCWKYRRSRYTLEQAKYMALAATISEVEEQCLYGEDWRCWGISVEPCLSDDDKVMGEEQSRPDILGAPTWHIFVYYRLHERHDSEALAVKAMWRRQVADMHSRLKEQ